MTEPVYDLKEQYDKIKSVLLPGEEIEGVFDLKGSGAQDDGNWVSGRGFFATSKLMLHTSHAQYELEFRGADKPGIA